MMKKHVIYAVRDNEETFYCYSMDRIRANWYPSLLTIMEDTGINKIQKITAEKLNQLRENRMYNKEILDLYNEQPTWIKEILIQEMPYIPECISYTCVAEESCDTLNVMHVRINRLNKIDGS